MSEEITKETFKWKLKDKEVSLDEMDVPFKITALIHTMKLSSKTHRNYEKYKRKKEKEYEQLNQELAYLEKKIQEFKDTEKKRKRKAEMFSKKSKDLFENLEYFGNLADVLETSLLEDHGLRVPDNIDDLWSFKRMYEKGIIKKTG